MIWAYDVAVGVLLAEAVQVAGETAEARRPDWWGEVVQGLRVNAVVGSTFAILLDEFTPEQRTALLGWIDEACTRLTSRGGVTAAEALEWDVLDGETVDLRGAEHVAAEPLVELGRAMAELVDGTLPPAPEGCHWYYGQPSGRSVV